MNPFDRAILEFINGFSRKSWTFDHGVYLLSHTDLLKGGVVVAVLWALWFAQGEQEAVAKTRRTILRTFAGTFVGLFLARVLAIVLPMRLRPVHQPGIEFLLPYGANETVLAGWNSFPSDHATLFVGLGTGIFLLSRRLGALTFLYIALAVLFPRLYLGLHYPTDILAGGLLGLLCVLAARGARTKKYVVKPLAEWAESHPALFYTGFFLVTYQTVVLYEDVREMANFAIDVARVAARRYF